MLQVSYSEAYAGATQVLSVTDAAGQVTRYTRDGGPGGALRITPPGATSDTTIVQFDPSDYRVRQITRDGVAHTYSYANSGSSIITTVTDPFGGQRVFTSNPDLGVVTSMSDEVGRTTSYSYDAQGRLLQMSLPGGNTVSYTYDDRGNIVERREKAKAGSGLADIVQTAAYSACGNVKTCNKPVSITDAKGRTTDITYNETHGGVSSIVLPAPSGGAPRPQISYGYQAFPSWTVNYGAGGTSPAPTYLPTTISECRTNTTCSGGPDEQITRLTYLSRNDGGNLLPSSTSVGAGDGSVVATTAFAYDDVGNLTASDGPLPGAVDVTNFTYDPLRRVTGIVFPDPDGSGPRQRRAKMFHYLPNGLVDAVSVGTTDANGGSFASQQQIMSSFDGNNRKTKDVLASGGTTYATTQYGYDALGRLQCTALRMDPGQWNGQTDACTPQTNGPNGPDRVSKLVYDGAGQVTSQYSAVGTADQVEEKSGYTASGKVSSVTDGNGNVTTYAYDGLDRLSTTSFPGGSFEQQGYDANGNVISKRLRDGQVIGYGYDALNRLVSRDRPNGVYWETDQSYAYDNLGHLTSASDSNGRVLGFGYDALGRRTSQSDNWYSLGNAAFQYDSAGRRTRFTWGDGNYVSYDYLATGEMSVIRDSGGNPLITFGYDDMGRRTSLSRANGTATTYAYDPASRVSALTLSGGNQSNALTFSYNPAGQITSRSSSNDAYAWTGAYNVDRGYGVNALNQLTSAGATGLGYDGRGNLTASGGTAYGYTVDNQLATAPGANLAYDPLGRLFNITADNGINTTLTYDGADVMAETNQSNGALLRRYVYGPGSDEPLIWYEGAGFGDRRWLHADERGSIVAVTNDAGNAIAVNSYDEYGIPGANNIGRFQYTGQKWLPSLGLYDYKARAYSPTLGRFMQTDPIGYGGGLNWYNYVGSDPINATDPSGLDKEFGFIRIKHDGGVSEKYRDIVVTALRDSNSAALSNAPAAGVGRPMAETGGDASPQSGIEAGADADIVVTARLPSCGLLCRVGRALGIGRVGAQGEAAVRAQIDIGPKVMINVDGQVRFPDGLNDTTLSEVKNVARLSYTSQLRSYVTYSQGNGLQFDLYVRSSTRLSAPLLGLQSQGVIRITNIPGM